VLSSKGANDESRGVPEGEEDSSKFANLLIGAAGVVVVSESEGSIPDNSIISPFPSSSSSSSSLLSFKISGSKVKDKGGSKKKRIGLR